MLFALAFLAFVVGLSVAAGLITHFVILAVASRRAEAFKISVHRAVRPAAPVPTTIERTLCMSAADRHFVLERERYKRLARHYGLNDQQRRDVMRDVQKQEVKNRRASP